MTVRRDPDAILAAWLDEGPNRLPEATRRAIAVTSRTTHQSRHPMWLPWRFPTMNGAAARVALGAAAVAAVALGGLYLLNQSPNRGVGGPSASPGPSPSPTTISFDSHGLGALEPGTYVIERLDSEAPLRITFTMPVGWEKLMVPGIVWSDGSDATLGFAVFDNLYVDPCAAQAVTHDPPVGPTVDDLVSALDVTPNLDARATDVTVAGFTGKQVDLVALGPWEPCAAGEPRLFPRGGPETDEPPPDPTDTHRLTILDVDGHRLVISRKTRPAATAANRADLQAIFDSIRIELTGSAPVASTAPTP
jgi:hypothetical protein